MDKFKRISASLTEQEYKEFETLISDFNSLKGTQYTKNSFIKLCIKLTKNNFYKKFVNKA